MAASLFVHGTLIDPACVHRLTGKDLPRRPAVLAGFRRIPGPPAFPHIVPDGTTTTPGMLLHGVDLPALERLDHYEQNGRLYSRRLVTVCCDGLAVEAHAYVGDPARIAAECDPDLEPAERLERHLDEEIDALLLRAADAGAADAMLWARAHRECWRTPSRSVHRLPGAACRARNAPSAAPCGSAPSRTELAGARAPCSPLRRRLPPPDRPPGSPQPGLRAHSPRLPAQHAGARAVLPLHAAAVGGTDALDARSADLRQDRRGGSGYLPPRPSSRLRLRRGAPRRRARPGGRCRRSPASSAARWEAPPARSWSSATLRPGGAPPGRPHLDSLLLPRLRPRPPPLEDGRPPRRPHRRHVR